MQAFMNRLARAFALVGGMALTMLIVMVCLSIFGRTLNTILHSDVVQSAIPGVASALLATGVGPINGDFELVEAGMAFTIFAFLPLCQLSGGHASVDIFTSKLPMRVNDALRAVIDIIFAGVLVMIAWQLFQGLLSKLNSGQTTLLLQYPVWWGYACCLSGAAAAALVAVYVAVARLIEVTTGQHILPSEQEADH